MERLLTRAALGLALINIGALAWLYQVPMPPPRIPPIEEVADPNEGVLMLPEDRSPRRNMAILDGILAERLIAEATARGVPPALPDDALREEAALAAADSEPALRLLAAYEHAFDALGLSLDGAP